MWRSRFIAWALFADLLLVLGCGTNSAPSPDKEAKIRASLEQLSPEDRKLAEEQTYCAVQTENRLGSMGKPVKVMLKDKPIFLCCESCTKKAETDPDKTLATGERLKSANRRTADK